MFISLFLKSLRATSWSNNLRDALTGGGCLGISLSILGVGGRICFEAAPLYWIANQLPEQGVSTDR